MMSIAKKALEADRCSRPSWAFASARSAFAWILSRLSLSRTDQVLLPAYIGWSPREGSGVFDPIRELRLGFSFYRVTPELTIDIQDIHSCLASDRVKVLVLIHYFGFPDPNAIEIAQKARSKGIFVVEDEAHAMLSDLVGGVCGRGGDAAIFSLHKLLPVDTGGALVFNRRSRILEDSLSRDDKPSSEKVEVLTEYDLHTISSIRRDNYSRIVSQLPPLKGRVDPLYEDLPPGVVPQSLPVLVTGFSRDDLYHKMNEAGYGVVSLYHTLIREIDCAAYPDSWELSRRILNLPVHQDVNPQEAEILIDRLDRFLSA